MQIGKIDLAKYVEFAIELFKENNKKIAKEYIETAYNSVDGVTLYVQFIMNELFQIVPQNQEVTRKLYDTALANLLNKQSFVYTNILSDITTNQKEVLFAIAKEGSDIEVTSFSFINKYNLKSSSSVQSSLKGLISKKIVAKEDGRYVVSDRLFRLWLLTL